LREDELIEIVVPLLVAFALGILGMVAWRSLRGPIRSRIHLAGRVAFVSLVVMILVAVSVWQFSKSRSLQFFGGMVTHVETSEPVVALTFDDGPAEGYTQEILEILGTEGVRATFFVTGQELARHPAEGQLIAAAGHELGNHTYSHRQMIGVGYGAVAEEIERTDELIRGTGYDGEIHVRPPYGKRFIVLPYYLRVNHRRTIYWDIEPESYGEIAGESGRIVAYVLGNVRPGSIILLHVMGSGRQATMRAVPVLIERLLARGYRFVAISELLAYAR
jgi:peptidoglycan/xylan/chitin deacetylase (PgdA/CDA1 family)